MQCHQQSEDQPVAFLMKVTFGYQGRDLRDAVLIQQHGSQY